MSAGATTGPTSTSLAQSPERLCSGVEQDLAFHACWTQSFPYRLVLNRVLDQPSVGYSMTQLSALGIEGGSCSSSFQMELGTVHWRTHHSADLHEKPRGAGN